MAGLRCIEQSNSGRTSVSRPNRESMKLHRPVDLVHWQLTIDRSRCRKLVVDCSGVEMMSSDTIGRLLILQRRMRERGGRLILSGLREEVRQMFAWTKLDRCFEIQAAAATWVPESRAAS